MNMNLIKSLIRFLNDPDLVSRTQELFGVKIIGVVKQKSDIELKANKNLKSVKLLNNQVCLYQVNNLFFYCFFQIITHLGNEIFYFMFLPILSWFYNAQISYLTTLSWAVMMFVGQAAKDIIKIARPETPPVVKMQDRYLLEYGFPSTHAMAMVNIAITFSTLVYQDLNYSSEYASIIISVITISAFITFSVCLSRIYLGMHSYLDILGGVMFALVYSLIFLRYSSAIMWFIKQGVLSAVIQCSLFIFMCLMYPCKNRWSPARADTFLIMGAAIGLSMAVGVRYSLNLNDIGKLSYDTRMRNDLFCLLLLCRFLVGIIPVLLVRFASKHAYCKFVKWAYGITEDSNIKEYIKKNFYLEMFYYLFCYSSIGFSAKVFSFFLFRALDI